MHMGNSEFTKEERQQIERLYRQLRRDAGEALTHADREAFLAVAAQCVMPGRDRFGFHPVITAMMTAQEIIHAIDADRNMLIATMLAPFVTDEAMPDGVEKHFGADVAAMVRGLAKVAVLYRRSASVESDNFRKLLLTFAQDIRTILIMIVDRLVLMRAINHHPAQNQVRETAYEANYLYAPLAHRLGLYAIKSELEDLSLKYSNREKYTEIARELNQTKKRRDAYIAAFIAPVREALEKTGIRFDIKGRTKSIYSIWNKLKKQQNTLEEIFDLFAIRIIIDCPREREKSECWMAYSVITDMFTPNPARLKDWISIPKSNGYESLHTTVKGPDGRWVEVQIRTRRMDEVAEKGLAAHWKYKGIKAESNLDSWMANVRDILETAHSGPMELIKQFKMDVYAHEVFVFTPRGDLYKLPQGATVLDFAFNIHSNVGLHCVGARIDGRVRKINHRLASGDTVEILTSPGGTPNRDWLAWVVTSKARNKIRSVLKEQENSSTEIGRELIERRFANRKIKLEEATMSRTVTKMGYKDALTFFHAVGTGELDVNDVVDNYLACMEKKVEAESVSAATYTMTPAEPDPDGRTDDVLVIGDNIKGVNYKLARCCNPVYGDDVFGFVSAEGVIKIHRSDCPNAIHLRERYPYRLIRTRWSGKAGAQYTAVLRVVGKDDIGIVTNITSIINKEKNVSLRGISIDSNDGLFAGVITVGITDNGELNRLIKKIATVKGVKNVMRNN